MNLIKKVLSMAADMRFNLGVSALYKLILLQYSHTIRKARRVTTPFESTKLEGAVPTGKPYFSLLHPGAEITKRDCLHEEEICCPIRI